MKEALKEAKKAFNLNEVPVGAVAVYQNEIIVRSHNFVEKSRDAASHAELICLKNAAKILGDWRLCDLTIYSSLEPCLMCFGAMTLFRIKHLVYAARDLRHGACESLLELSSIKHPIHNFTIKGGVLEKESSDLLKKFFKLRRDNGKIS